MRLQISLDLHSLLTRCMSRLTSLGVREMVAEEKVSYDPKPNPLWTTRAAKTMNHWIQPDLAHPRVIFSQGKCPRCHDLTENRHPLVFAAPGVAKDVSEDAIEEVAGALERHQIDLGHGEVEFDIRCKCGEPHKGHPEEDLSCGAEFRVRVAWP